MLTLPTVAAGAGPVEIIESIFVYVDWCNLVVCGGRKKSVCGCRMEFHRKDDGDCI